MTRRNQRSLLNLGLAATALLVGGCCDQNCDCELADVPAKAEAQGNAVGSATGNNSPLVESVAATLTGCAGTSLPQTLKLTDPDGDGVTLDHSVADAPISASVRLTPELPLTVDSGKEVEIGVFCDTAGDVRIEFTVVDSYGRAGEGPYAVVYHFQSCPPSEGGVPQPDAGPETGPDA